MNKLEIAFLQKERSEKGRFVPTRASVRLGRKSNLRETMRRMAEEATCCFYDGTLPTGENEDQEMVIERKLTEVLLQKMRDEPERYPRKNVEILRSNFIKDIRLDYLNGFFSVLYKEQKDKVRK